MGSQAAWALAAVMGLVACDRGSADTKKADFVDKADDSQAATTKKAAEAPQAEAKAVGGTVTADAQLDDDDAKRPPSASGSASAAERSPNAAALAMAETLTAPKFREPVARVQLGCGRLTARLPRMSQEPTCAADDPLPSMLLGGDRCAFELESNLSSGPTLVLVMEEQPLSASEREALRAAWPQWPSRYITGSPRLRIQREHVGAGLEVRIDDGSTFRFRIEWPEGEQYVDGDQPSAALNRQVDRDRERLYAQLVLTLAPGTTQPMSAGTMTLPVGDVDLVSMTVTDDVFVTAYEPYGVGGRPEEVEPHCPARFVVRARGSRSELSHERALLGSCDDGRIVHRVSDTHPGIEAVLASIRASRDHTHQ